MFNKKLLAFVCSGVCASWIVVWSGYNLSELSKSHLDYLLSFYGRDNLRLKSDYFYDSFEYSDGFEDWLDE